MNSSSKLLMDSIRTKGDAPIRLYSQSISTHGLTETVKMKEQVWLTPEQVREMREACWDRFRNPRRNTAIIAFAYDTGLRRSEVAEIERSMIDLSRAELHVPPDILKDFPNENEPKPRTLGLAQDDATRDTIEVIRSWLDEHEDESLFGIGDQTVNYVVKEAAIAADVTPKSYQRNPAPEHVSSHTLRHSVAYRMLNDEEGYTLNDVKRRLGHSSILTTERHYEHWVKA